MLAKRNGSPLASLQNDVVIAILGFCNCSWFESEVSASSRLNLGIDPWFPDVVVAIHPEAWTLVTAVCEVDTIIPRSMYLDPKTGNRVSCVEFQPDLYTFVWQSGASTVKVTFAVALATEFREVRAMLRARGCVVCGVLFGTSGMFWRGA